MYEKPQLNRVGEAQEVILGIIQSGPDLDMNWVPDGMEFAADGNEFECPASRT